MNREKSLTRNILLAGLVLSLVISAVYFVHPSVVRFFNDKAMDAIMAMDIPSTSVTNTVVIVDLDEQSLERYGQWPWPRYRLAQLLTKLERLGAQSIGLDLILSEPDRTSPHNWRMEIANDLGYQIEFSNVPPEVIDHDSYLASVLQKGPYVIGYEFLFNEKRASKQACNLHPLPLVRIDRGNAHPNQFKCFQAEGVICSLPVLAQAVKYSGFLNATPDADGILRRTPLVIQYGDQFYPAFTLATFMQYQQPKQITINEEKNGFIYLFVDGKKIPIDCQGNMLINFGDRAMSLKRLSAADVLGDRVAPESLTAKMVLVVSSAAGWEQTYQAAHRPVTNYGEILAHIIESINSGRFTTRTSVFVMWETLAAIVIVLVLCIGIAKTGLLLSTFIGVIGLSATWLGTWGIFRFNGYLFSPVLPSILVILNFGILTIYKTRKHHHFAREKADSTLVLLKASENNLDSIVQTIPDIVFRVDPEGHITFISPAIAKYTSSPEEMVGKPILDFVPEEDTEKARYRLKERRTGDRATNDMELRMLLQPRQESNENEIGYFSVSAEGIYSEDRSGNRRFIGTQGIIRDITSQKSLENKLVQAQKMEAIGNLASGIAHDLNNVLSGLVSYPDLLLLELPEDSPLREKVEKIQQSGKNAAAIVGDLLSLARRSQNISKVVDLNDMIAAHLTSFEFDNLQLSHPEISLEPELDPDLMHVWGSPVHLSKVLMNLINNAYEAMPAGGRVRLSTFNTYLDTNWQGYEEIPEGEYCCLRVADNGVGIESADLKRIFEPFYTKKMMGRSGTGLGMTVIWATVKDHGGYIDIRSSEGEGTCIDVFLPATRETAEPKDKRPVLEDFLGDERILVVDDIADQLEIAVNMLSKLGYNVSAVSSGEEAVEFISKEPVDLLVLDMVMPGGIDGLETYRRIIEFHPNQKAIIASGYSETKRVKTLQELGAGTYIQKPYTLGKIGVAVRQELDRR